VPEQELEERIEKVNDRIRKLSAISEARSRKGSVNEEVVGRKLSVI